MVGWRRKSRFILGRWPSVSITHHFTLLRIPLPSVYVCAVALACEMRPNDKLLNAREKYIEGRIAFISKQKDQALASWKKASELDPTWAMPPNGVGVIYNEKKNFEAARKYLFEAVRREASWAVPYNSIGTSLLS